MMRGIVLCGGESKRMGSDKGLLPIGTNTWAQYAAGKLGALNIPVLVSVSKVQFDGYRSFFAAEQLVIDQVAAKGPLTGLLSAHLRQPDDDLLLLACDMTEMGTDTLKTLQHSAAAFPGYDCYVYARIDFMEPLCAVYTSGFLKKIYRDLESGSLPNFSLHKLIRQGNYMPLEIQDREHFNNHNQPPFKL